MDKKEYLLQQIIQAYLRHLEPIGSSQLKNMYNIDFSPATIRGYFKKLGDEGYLAQEHISSGRVPTYEALKEYWSKRLNFELADLNLNHLIRLAKSLGLTILFKETKELKLQNIYNFDNSFLVLDFGLQKINIKFNGAIARFLQDLVGLDMRTIIDVASQVGAVELKIELQKSMRSNGFEIINLKPLISMLNDYDFEENYAMSFLNGEILDKISQGLHFEKLLPSGFLGACHECKIEGKDSKILIIGQLSTDYLYFYNNLRGA